MIHLQLGIETSNLSKVYSKVTSLDTLNLNVPYGKCHLLLGPNGAGKTTCLKILAGLEKPTRGRAIVGGFDVKVQPLEVKRRIGYLPENPVLYDTLTSSEFLQFVGDIFKIPRDVREDRIRRYSDELEIGDYFDSFIGDLSKGETQRVLITSILMREPKIFLLDEPFFSLDPIGSIKFRKILKEKCIQGATVLIATHMLEFAEKIGDSYTIIVKGKIKAQGTLDQSHITTNPLEKIFAESLGVNV